MDLDTSRPLRISRRQLLVGAGAAAATGLGLGAWRLFGTEGDVSSAPVRARPSAIDGLRWSDPRAWPEGRVPGAGDRAIIGGGAVILDRDAEVGGLTIEEGAALIFAPDRTLALASSGNVVVRGSIVMRPDAAENEHVLRFVSVDETKFVGGHTEDPLESDVGMWVLGTGVVDAAGSTKLPWTRVIGSLVKGRDSFELDQDPVGWRVGDRVVITPTGPGSSDTYEDGRIVRLSGRTVGIDSPMKHDHPEFAAHGVRLTAEVLNLTRNVRIEGTPQGRAHIMFLRSGKQDLAHVELAHLGPRKGIGDFYRSAEITEGVTGRYPVHFHLCGDRTRGTLMTGCVAHNVSQHAFVTHESHGVTYSGCTAHDVVEDAFWWDDREDKSVDGPPSNDVLYDRCVASLVRFDPEFRGNRIAGFKLLRGSGNRCIDCVSVGVQGTKDAAGFVWPEGADGVWVFRGNVSHNNLRHGTFVWQNSNNRHVVERFVSYRNGGFGVSHGAYRNHYLYRDALVAENGEGPLLLHAVSARPPHLEFANMVLDASGRAYAAQGTQHNERAVAVVPTDINRCTLTGYTQAAYGFTWDKGADDSGPELVTLRDCRADDDRKVYLSTSLPPNSSVMWASDGPGADIRSLRFVTAAP